jgi:hypothetical protein
LTLRANLETKGGEEEGEGEEEEKEQGKGGDRERI